MSVSAWRIARYISGMHMRIALVLGIALLTPPGPLAAPVTNGHPVEFPGNGHGPPQGWFPGGGNSGKEMPGHGPSSPGGEWTDTEETAPALSPGPPVLDNGSSLSLPGSNWLPGGYGADSNGLPVAASIGVDRVNAVPIPSTLLLSAAALGILAGTVHRRRR